MQYAFFNDRDDINREILVKYKNNFKNVSNQIVTAFPALLFDSFCSMAEKQEIVGNGFILFFCF
jgi:hypothetical protein